MPLSLCRTDFSCQCIKLVCIRHPFEAFEHHLTLANHVHEFDPGQDFGGRSKGFETEHGSGDAFDGSVILLDDVVEVWDYRR